MRGQSRFREMKHDAVAEELDGAPTVGLSGVGNELSQPSGQTCSPWGSKTLIRKVASRPA